MIGLMLIAVRLLKNAVITIDIVHRILVVVMYTVTLHVTI